MEAQERAAAEAEAVALGTQVQQLTTAARWAASVLPDARASRLSQQGESGGAPEGPAARAHHQPQSQRRAHAVTTLSRH